MRACVMRRGKLVVDTSEDRFDGTRNETEGESDDVVDAG